MMIDWYYRRESDTGRMILVRKDPSASAVNITDKHRRIFGERLPSRPDGATLVFQSVRGEMTCADIALRDPDSLPFDQLRSFLSATCPAIESRSVCEPNVVWGAFRRRLDVQEADNATRTRATVLEFFDAEPDRRLGTASLVPDREGEGLDALLTSETESSGSAGRVVGELLEIACLNMLYKPGQYDGGVDDIRGLIELVGDPDDVRRTWAAHLARTLDLNPSQWRAQIDAIELAETLLSDLWNGESSGFADEGCSSPPDPARERGES